jgi:hypothetical protein
MLAHYSNHAIDGDIERIRQAQTETFGRLLPETINTNFDMPERERNTGGQYTVNIEVV